MHPSAALRNAALALIGGVAACGSTAHDATPSFPDAGSSSLPDATSPASRGDATIKIARDGGVLPDAAGPSVAIIATSQTYGYGNLTIESPVNDLAVDDAGLFWGNGTTDDAGGAIVAATLSGSSPVVLASATLPAALAIDSQNVYFADWLTGQTDGAETAICQVPRHGGSKTILARRPVTTLAVAVDGSYVYWVEQGTWSPDGGSGIRNDGTIARVPIGGGAVSTVVASTSILSGVAVDATGVYWNDLLKGVFVLRSGASTAEELVATTDLWGYGNGIAIDDAYVYFARGEGVSRVPKTGGAPTVLTQFTNDSPLGLALVGADLYYTSSGGSDGVIRHVSLADGSVTAIAQGADTLKVGSIAASASAVYWQFFDGKTGGEDLARWTLSASSVTGSK